MCRRSRWSADAVSQSVLGEEGVDRRGRRSRQALQRNTTPQLALSPVRQSPAVVQRPADRLRLSVAPLTHCAVCQCHKSGSDQLRWNPGPARLLTTPDLSLTIDCRNPRQSSHFRLTRRSRLPCAVSCKSLFQLVVALQTYTPQQVALRCFM